MGRYRGHTHFRIPGATAQLMRTKEIRPFYPGGVPGGGSEPPPSSGFPDDITGLWSRLDASDTDSITVGSDNDVTRWADISGNGRDGTPAGLNSTPPKTGQATVNGLNALSFDQNLVQALSHAAKTYRDRTYFAVVDSTSAGGAILGTETGSELVYFRLNAGNGSLGGNGAEFRSGNNPYFSGGGSASIFADLPADHSQTNVLGWVFGDPLKLTVNGQIGPNTPSRLSSAEQPVGPIGARYFPGVPEYRNAWTGNLCEVVIYDRVLTDEEVGRVNDYLIQKWGA